MADLATLLNPSSMTTLSQEELDRVVGVVTRPIDPKQIKERDAGFGKKLSYISGSTVINLLNEAFAYQWTFRVLRMEVIQSLPKWDKRKNENIEQPPYVQVLGQLIVPSLGIVKEQYGSKALIGGESEQEGASKAAATDALKKCATLLGIGIELYEDEPVKPPKPTIEWPPAEVSKLKEYKAVLGIVDNNQLDPYVREFLGDGSATFKVISPLNISAFNTFLKKKAEEA